MSISIFSGFCTAWKASIREGISRKGLVGDTIAGIVVGVISLPLSMAFAISAGMSPQSGLYTAIVGGFVAGVFGGSRFQVSGPTAAFVVILIPIVREYGPAGLMISTVGAGVVLLLMGLLRWGKLIDFISFPVIAGFTLGIGISVAILQLRAFFGVVAPPGDTIIHELVNVSTHLSSFSEGDLIVGFFTLLALFVWSFFFKNIPAPLVVLPISCILGVFLPEWIHLARISTIANHFSTTINGMTVHGIPPLCPTFSLPWNFPEGGTFHFTFSNAFPLLQGSFTIAILCSIETLVTAVCGDRLTGTRHDPNGELIGHGLASLVAPFFGGFGSSGAIPRTAANIQAGGKTPWASLVHSAFLLAAVLLFARYLGYLPLAAMAALLIYVAYFMSDIKGCVDIVRNATREEGGVLLLCAVLTVLFSMVTAIAVGLIVTSFLFMYKMTEMASTKEGVEVIHPDQEVDADPLPTTLPEGFRYFKIQGALFFGSAGRMTSEIKVEEGAKYVLIDFHDVPLIDSTGISQLKVTIKQLLDRGLVVALTRVQPIPLVMLRSTIKASFPQVRFFRGNSEAFRILQTPISEVLPLGSHI